jgi:hypothetical protein
MVGDISSILDSPRVSLILGVFFAGAGMTGNFSKKGARVLFLVAFLLTTYGIFASGLKSRWLEFAYVFVAFCGLCCVCYWAGRSTQPIQDKKLKAKAAEWWEDLKAVQKRLLYDMAEGQLLTEAEAIAQINRRESCTVPFPLQSIAAKTGFVRMDPARRYEVIPDFRAAIKELYENSRKFKASSRRRL